VHGEIKKFVATIWVMRHFFILQGRQELTWTFVRPTAVSRLIIQYSDIARMKTRKGIASRDYSKKKMLSGEL
jgi:hypothetical protein